jgi:ubiquinone/menaquinone biosynthesis C-methylase UbiE
MNEDLKRWDDAADEWVNKIIPQGQLSEYLTKQILPDLLGSLNGKIVLDAGCGNGRFTVFLKGLGAEVIGIDGSPKMVELARQSFPGIKFETQDLLSRLDFETGTFDAIICDNVLMSMEDIKPFLKEGFRILKEDGSLVVSVLHPAFNHPTMKLYKTFLDKLLSKKASGLAFNYFQGKTTRREKNATNGFNFYHRTIEAYSKLFSEAGFLIKQILEPHVTDQDYIKNNPRIEYASRLPRFIFFKLIKS